MSELRKIALRLLAPVGNRAHEWEEKGEIAFHLRRRLAPEEEVCVGPAIDFRRTEEAVRRFAALQNELPPGTRRWAVRSGELAE
jgi:hypothetical protein